MIALQIAVDILMDLTIDHTSASDDPRASHYHRALIAQIKLNITKISQKTLFLF